MTSSETQVSQDVNSPDLDDDPFVDCGKRLFGEKDAFRIIRLLEDGELRDCTISDDAMLETEHQTYGLKTRDVYYILPQRHSWSIFDMTKASFQKLLLLENILPQFVDLFKAFGFKMHTDQDPWDCCYGQIYKDSEGRHRHYELCYNVRFMEKNGRDYDGGWSLRQTGVYQRFDLESRRSCWVFLQPSLRVRSLLQGFIHSHTHAESSMELSIKLHLSLLTWLEAQWREYTEKLRHDVDELDNKACYTDLAPTHPYGFKTEFSDCQKLHLLRQKLLRMSWVLETSLETARKCEKFFQLWAPSIMISSSKIIGGFDTYATAIARHQRAVNFQLERSLGTLSVLSKIVEISNSRALQSSSQAIRENLAVLRQLASQSEERNETLAILAGHTQRDSRLLKALTFIATMYLPASLVATVFSSNLVESQTNTDPAKAPTHFVLATQFWLYAVISISLTVVTLSSAFLFDKIWATRSRRLKAP